MKIRNIQLGEIVVAEEALVHLPEGLIGFEKAAEFVLHQPPEYEPFAWLLSTNDPDLGFAVADPAHLSLEPCQLKIGEAEEALLELRPDDPLEVYVLVSPAGGGTSLTANMKGPILVNRRNGRAKQIVLYSGRYSSRQPVRLDHSHAGPLRPVRGRASARTLRRRAA